jgi:hypothetical protein
MLIDKQLPSQDAMEEAAYLIARGVRPLAIFQSLEGDHVVALRALTLLERYASDGAIPFVFKAGGGLWECGYAAAAWVLDLYRFLVIDANIPHPHLQRIIGVLLGYSPSAITRFEEHASGRNLFPSNQQGESDETTSSK